MPDGPEASQSTLNYFVDEAGDPVLFSRKGKILVESEGCSNYFILEKLEIDDPEGLSRQLEQLRSELLAEPYFRGVPSMQVERKRTALAFHAKDDPAEVRREVFKLLIQQQVRFYAVVRDKSELLAYVRQKNERDESYRYDGNELYDTLVSELFSKLHRLADRVNICFAKRHRKPRDRALREALEKADHTFEQSFGFAHTAETEIMSSTPPKSGGLQAIDYYLWALQRFYERGEERYVELIWPQIGEVHDLDFVEDGRRGVFYRKDKPLNLATRQRAKK